MYLTLSYKGSGPYGVTQGRQSIPLPNHWRLLSVLYQAYSTLNGVLRTAQLVYRQIGRHWLGETVCLIEPYT